MSKDILVVTTGGTIDALPRVEDQPYTFRKRSHAKEMLAAVGARVMAEGRCEFKHLPPIDSIDMNSEYRGLIIDAIQKSKRDRALILHGTDTMVETGHALADAHVDKMIVLTGAFIPFSEDGMMGENGKSIKSDALFNVGFALGHLLGMSSNRIDICMNATTFPYYNAAKDTIEQDFKTVRELTGLSKSIAAPIKKISGGFAASA